MTSSTTDDQPFFLFEPKYLLVVYYNSISIYDIYMVCILTYSIIDWLGLLVADSLRQYPSDLKNQGVFAWRSQKIRGCLLGVRRDIS